MEQIIDNSWHNQCRHFSPDCVVCCISLLSLARTFYFCVQKMCQKIKIDRFYYCNFGIFLLTCCIMFQITVDNERLTNYFNTFQKDVKQDIIVYALFSLISFFACEHLNLEYISWPLGTALCHKKANMPHLFN